LPPQGFLVDGTQNVEGLCSLVALSQLLGTHSVFEFGTFTGVTALTLAVNMPQLVVHTLDLPLDRMSVLEIENSDRSYMPLRSRQRVFESRLEAARITQHEGDSAKFNFAAFGQKSI